MRIPDEPTWPKTTKRIRKYKPLKGDLEIDTLVVGGGMAGINCLYNLTKAKVKAALIEADELGEGATEYTTAFLTHVLDTDIVTLREMFGPTATKLAWESHKKAISFYEKIIQKEKIDCEFIRCSYFLYTTNPQDTKSLQKQGELAKKLGFPIGIQPTNDLPFDNYGYLEVKNQAKFHPLKYLFKLAEKAVDKGAQIFEKTEALEILDDKPIVVSTNRGEITAKNVIIATYAPFTEPITYKLRKAMYQDYVYEMIVPKNTFREGLYADNENPYHYWRVDSQKRHDRLIVGGETQREELAVNDKINFDALKKHFFGIMPKVKFKFVRRWTGPLLEPSDGLAYIGNFLGSKNIYVATGFSGTGMTYSAIAAELLTDLIKGKKNPYAKLYDAQRKMKPKALLKKGKDYTGTLLGGAVKNIISP